MDADLEEHTFIRFLTEFNKNNKYKYITHIILSRLKENCCFRSHKIDGTPISFYAKKTTNGDISIHITTYVKILDKKMLLNKSTLVDNLPDYWLDFEINDLEVERYIKVYPKLTIKI